MYTFKQGSSGDLYGARLDFFLLAASVNDLVFKQSKKAPNIRTNLTVPLTCSGKNICSAFATEEHNT